MTIAHPLRLVILLATLGCPSGPSGASAPDSKRPDATKTQPDATKAQPTPAGISDDVKAKVCSAEDNDATSTYFLALDGSGAIHRIIVTPSRDIADLGNGIFDAKGNYLGSDTGGEFPWDDEEIMTKEHARVDALMDGAKIPDGAKAKPCG